MSLKVTETSRSRGKHRRGSTPTVVKILAAGAVASTVVGGFAVTRTDDAADANCGSVQELRVATAPAVAPAVRRVAERNPSLRCVRIAVTGEDPAAVASAMSAKSAGSDRPDVWIPDSSVWLGAVSGGGNRPAPPSVATSPVVLAVPTAAFRRPGAAATIEAVARAAVTPRPVRLRLPRLVSSAVAQAALVALERSLSGTPADRGYLAALLRAMDVTGGDARSTGLSPGRARADGAPVAEATTEQAVWATNKRLGRTAFTAVYPPAPGHLMDFPYAEVATDAAARRAAESLLVALRSDAGRKILADFGFRDAPAAWRSTGTPATSPTLTPALGVRPEEASRALPLSGRDAKAARDTAELLERPSRVLALVDVSGSMAALVPGAPGLTRIDLARTAIRRTLGMFSPGSVAGIWQFSANLTPSTNYEELLPLIPLSPGSQPVFRGVVERLAPVPFGGTGLYDSTLAAVRYVRSVYDQERINSVVVLTDGRNESAGAHGIPLTALLRGLAADNDPERPVPVIGIAYGPDSDVAALRTIAGATGGTVYTARDPRDLPLIFNEAIGHRLCGTAC